MKFNPIPLLTAFLLSGFFSFAQVQRNPSGDESKYVLKFRNTSFVPQKNISVDQVALLNRKAVKINRRSFVIIQFETIPTQEQRNELKRSGIELLDYIPNNAYTATIKDSVSLVQLTRLKARAIFEPGAELKMDEELAKGNFPAHAVKVPGTVDVWINFPRSFTYETVSNELQKRNFDIILTDWRQYQVIALRAAANRLTELASLPFTEFLQAMPKEDETLNNKSTVNSRANILQSSLAGERNLHGEGVVIGIGDDAYPLNHIDVTQHLINRYPTTGGSHGLHVMTTAAGAGIADERYTGYASKATIVSQAFSNILAYAPAYVSDYGMVITNNSYGNVASCAAYGVYDIYSRIMDQQAFQMPHLQHVFSSGNSGGTACTPYSGGYGTVFGSYQASKNVLTVGNTTELGVSHSSSSKGPVRDGRIKPEIAAQGTLVFSAYPFNNYGFRSGTSMAAPAVSGGLALLYQRYRELHSGSDPKNGLMKALVCNGATDNGNPGPDYSNGFGWMNLYRSVKMIENVNYINDSVNAGATKTHTITIPGGASIAQLKVMLYWNDSAASVLSSHALVNDLDLEVSDPTAVVHLPYKLDTLPANVANNAGAGVDHINNIEQVVINNPVAGTYTFSVKGTTIPFAPRYEYFVVYDTVPVSTKLTYPIGGEHLVMGDSLYISWDAFGNPSNDFTLQYSTDNGTSWTTINAIPVASNLRLLKWFIPVVAMDPSIITDQARIKLIHNGTGLQSISEAFTIIGVPAMTTSQCDGYITLNWGSITGATDYEVMILREGDMVPVATTAALTYTIGGLSKDSVYWVSVRSRINGKPGRRAVGVPVQPNGGVCGGTISDNDIRMEAILSPALSGRKLTSTELSNIVSVTVRIKNLDNAVTTGNIPVAYKVGVNPQVNETITAPNIASGATFDYTFTTQVDMSAVGVYPMVVSVSYPGDVVHANDTIVKVFKQLDNPAINLASPFLDNIETATAQSYNTGQIGFDGLDRYDFVASNSLGRLRTFVNSGIAYSGSKALTLDVQDYSAGGTADSLKGTFNLQGYNVNTDDIRLDFQFKNHGQLSNAASKVWIRGSDQQPWIQAYDLYANQPVTGVFVKSGTLELNDLLTANSQAYTSSFQVRWGEWGQMQTTDNLNTAGYTFDDIHLFIVTDDIQMISIDSPVVVSCGLSNATKVVVTLRNSSNATITNIPVTFKADGNTPVTEIISSVAANTTVQYTFTATADLSVIGPHTLQSWVDLLSDTYRTNDTASINLFNSPLINVFPYLQNFETDNGSWYSNGTNDSWEYGTPASAKINGAASGSKAWKTSLVGNYNDLEESFLYSPCFDLTGMSNPTLSFSLALDLEDCGGAGLCDGAFVQYSADGVSWSTLGTVGAGTNWYNHNYSGTHLWSVNDYTRWHVATIPLPTGISRLRLRFVMISDPYVSFEGIAIDDIHVYNNPNGIYTTTGTSPVVTQSGVSGSNWIDFIASGKLIASINPNGQNLGNTDVQSYIYTGSVRWNTRQYYANRNITIKPSSVNLADSATVRFYYLDTESEAVLNATGCNYCSKPTSAYGFGVSKYSDGNDAFENGTLSDNDLGNWLFIPPVQAIKVPFDRGYYAEFKVKDFSEFWLNNGGLSNNQALPVELVSFTATKQPNKDVMVEWVTASEDNIARYEVEVAKGNDEYRQNHFVKIGQVNSNGNSTTEQHYQLIDAENYKFGVRYYRLKTIDRDGRFTYSAIRPVVFDEEIQWQVYPNPSSGRFNMVYQANAGGTVNIKVYDINGKEVKQTHIISNGFVQKEEINLAGNHFGRGMYLMEVQAGDQKRTFRLIKQ